MQNENEHKKVTNCNENNFLEKVFIKKCINEMIFKRMQGRRKIRKEIKKKIERKKFQCISQTFESPTRLLLLFVSLEWRDEIFL